MSFLDLMKLNRRINRYTDIEAPWSLAKKPLVAHVSDEEFEGDPSRWTPAAGGILQDTLSPYDQFSTAGEVRYSLKHRPSWLMFQPNAGGASVRVYHKGITVTTNFLCWGRFSWNSRYTATPAGNDHSLAIELSQTVNGAPSGNDNYTFYINETDLNEYAIQTTSNIAGGVGPSVEVILALATEKFSLSHFAVQKIANTIHFYVGTDSGTWIYLPTLTMDYTGGAMPDRVGILCFNGATTTPGNMILGCDYIRFKDGASFLP